jgi:hypothetical protein
MLSISDETKSVCYRMRVLGQVLYVEECTVKIVAIYFLLICTSTLEPHVQKLSTVGLEVYLAMNHKNRGQMCRDLEVSAESTQPGSILVTIHNSSKAIAYAFSMIIRLVPGGGLPNNPQTFQLILNPQQSKHCVLGQLIRGAYTVTVEIDDTCKHDLRDIKVK